ncbi:MAG: SDR family oxidoreductase [Spirochaetales bacterium]|nr:SDR family oxidoreductase [Spirochaetales bacterium]
MNNKPLALITGASRKIGIGSAIAIELSKNGWDIAITYWGNYDKSMPWGSNTDDIQFLEDEIKKNGSNFYSIEANLSDTSTPKFIFDSIEEKVGNISALILSHCYSVDSCILTTTVDNFDLHFDINTRASWLLIKEFAERFKYQKKPGRIIALTSDHTAFNLPYGASKGALDRIVLAAAEELRDKRILANVINPGANDTGWMDNDFKQIVKKHTFQDRVGTPKDTANLISFLCSDSGEWINGQLICSDGGVRW